MHRVLAVALQFLVPSLCVGADLADLAPNTWVPIKPKLVQRTKPEEQGQWVNAGWNKLVFDPDAKRVLFYDRWSDSKHGGTTIYGNCLFSFDPSSALLRPLKIDHWTKQLVPGGKYRTAPLPENSEEETPCSRHVYHGFDYVPELKAIYICNGANQTAVLKNKVVGHVVCADTWRLDLADRTWTKLAPSQHPANKLEDGMAYCPDTKSIVYAGHGKVWILDVVAGQWRKSTKDLPRPHMGMSAFYDAPRKRMLLAGGGTYGKWQTRDGGFNTFYALDPLTEKITRLADCPTALCRAALAHDTKQDLFFVAVTLKGPGVSQPSGLFAYDPVQDTWRDVKSAKAVPMNSGWMPLCYDAERDCLIGMAGTMFYAFRSRPRID